MRTLHLTQFSVYVSSATGGVFVRCPKCDYLMSRIKHRTYECKRCNDDDEPWQLADDAYTEFLKKGKLDVFDSTMRALSRGGEGEDFTFTCELCEKVRGDHQRREPDSEICIKCVQEAGFE